MKPEELSVLIFDGKSSKISRALSWLCRDASHVGIVLPAYVVAIVARLLDCKDFETEHDWYIFESTTENMCEDVITGKKIRGVSIVPFDERVKSYGGAISMRHLDRNVNLFNDDFKGYSIKALVQFVTFYHGKPYERSFARLAGALLDRFDFIKSEDSTSVFCSELVALLFQEIEILESKAPAEEAHPGDFAALPNSHLKFIDGNDFINGYSLGVMVEVL